MNYKFEVWVDFGESETEKFSYFDELCKKEFKQKAKYSSHSGS